MDVKTTAELSCLGLQLFHRGGQLTEVLFSTLLGTLRFDYEYEIEYKYDFSNLVCVVLITACHTNLFLGSPHLLVKNGKEREF